MSSLGVSTTVEQDHRHSSLIFRVITTRRLAGITLQTRLTELHADEDSLTALGDLGGYGPGVLHLSWSRVRELHYAPARVGELGGLYAREGTLCSRCIAPRISESQTTQLLTCLFQRLPALAHTVEVDLETLAHTSPFTSLDLSPAKPTPHAPSFSHSVSPALHSITGREHESARRFHRGTAGPL